MSDLPLEDGSRPVSRLASPSLHQYGSLLSRYLAPQAGNGIWMAVLLLVGIGLRLANPQVIRYFLDTATSGGADAPGSKTNALLVAALIFIGFAIFQQVLGLAARLATQAVAWAATNQLRSDLTLHVLRLDMPFHKTHTPGELIDRVDGDVNQLANFFSQFSVSLLGNSLLVLGILIMLFLENVWLGLGMLIYTGLTLLVLRWIQSLAVPRWAAERQAGAELYGYIEERVSGAEEIRAAGAEAHALHRLQNLSNVSTVKTRAASVVSNLTYNLTNLVYGMGYAAGLALAVFLYTRGQASLGAAYLITYYIGMLAEPLQSIRAQVEDLQQAGASIQRIQELFDLRPRVGDPFKSTVVLPQGALAVEFEHVSFRYEDEPIDSREAGPEGLPPGGTNDNPASVLKDVAFTIHPGRVLGILGRTGSGKSTLTRLLFRLYDPSSGVVKLGGVDLRMVQLAELRERVGMVTQDVQLFQASLRENLTFFNTTISDQRLEVALRELRLWDWVNGLPGGLNASLSGGSSLSAGEAQLFAFARVFLKDPGLIILDEASSRLDPSTEALMERAVDRLFAGRTGVVIAHRLKTVQRADDILILEDGRVVEYGPRLALAADPGSRFARLLQTGLEEALA